MPAVRRLAFTLALILLPAVSAAQPADSSGAWSRFRGRWGDLFLPVWTAPLAALGLALGLGRRRAGRATFCALVLAVALVATA